eukprot:PhM_4_TR440/c0_g1_i1/m.84059
MIIDPFQPSNPPPISSDSGCVGSDVHFGSEVDDEEAKEFDEEFEKLEQDTKTLHRKMTRLHRRSVAFSNSSPKLKEDSVDDMFDVESEGDGGEDDLNDKAALDLATTVEEMRSVYAELARKKQRQIKLLTNKQDALVKKYKGIIAEKDEELDEYHLIFDRMKGDDGSIKAQNGDKKQKTSGSKRDELLANLQLSIARTFGGDGSEGLARFRMLSRRIRQQVSELRSVVVTAKSTVKMSTKFMSSTAATVETQWRHALEDFLNDNDISSKKLRVPMNEIGVDTSDVLVSCAPPKPAPSDVVTATPNPLADVTPLNKRKKHVAVEADIPDAAMESHIAALKAKIAELSQNIEIYSRDHGESEMKISDLTKQLEKERGAHDKTKASLEKARERNKKEKASDPAPEERTTSKPTPPPPPPPAPAPAPPQEKREAPSTEHVRHVVKNAQNIRNAVQQSHAPDEEKERARQAEIEAKRIQRETTKMILQSISHRLKSERKEDALKSAFTNDTFRIIREHVYCYLCGRGAFNARRVYRCDGCYEKLYRGVPLIPKAPERPPLPPMSAAMKEKLDNFLRRNEEQQKAKLEAQERQREEIRRRREEVYYNLCDLANRYAPKMMLLETAAPSIAVRTQSSSQQHHHQQYPPRPLSSFANNTSTIIPGKIRPDHQQQHVSPPAACHNHGNAFSSSPAIKHNIVGLEITGVRSQTPQAQYHRNTNNPIDRAILMRSQQGAGSSGSTALQRYMTDQRLQQQRELPFGAGGGISPLQVTKMRIGSDGDGSGGGENHRPGRSGRCTSPTTSPSSRAVHPPSRNGKLQPLL